VAFDDIARFSLVREGDPTQESYKNERQSNSEWFSTSGFADHHVVANRNGFFLFRTTKEHTPTEFATTEVK
jgi:hypothetical protein